jgi:glycogen debranching enzyme
VYETSPSRSCASFGWAPCPSIARRAYHQGTVWAWLIGPYVDAYLRLHPEELSTARKFLEGFVPHLDEACIGSISEVFDAEAPYTPRGCIAQSWSVAEVLRCWVRTAGA